MSAERPPPHSAPMWCAACGRSAGAGEGGYPRAPMGRVLLYDLTSTYFENDPPFPEGDKRRHGYSRDHRGDCVQVIIALVVDAGRAAARLRGAAGQYRGQHRRTKR